MTATLFSQSFDAPSGLQGSTLEARTVLAWLQEAAGRDATARGAGLERLRERGLAWVLLRLVLRFDPGPPAAKSFIVTTWPTRWSGATAERDFRVEDDGGRRVAAATSRWAVFDLASRRAVRVPDFVRALPLPTASPALALPPFAEPAGAALSPLGEQFVEVGPADLDALGHANNTRYVDWALGALPAGFSAAHDLAGLDLAFKREARAGDRLSSRAALREDGAVWHELTREGEGEACATLLSLWRSRSVNS